MNDSFNFMKILRLGSVLLLFLYSCQNQKSENDYQYPADFDKVGSTCFIWTVEYNEIIPEISRIISMKDKVTIFYDERETDTTDIYNILKNNKFNSGNIKLVNIGNKPKSNWIRDFGPVYLINSKGRKKIIDFGYFGKRLGFNSEIAKKNELPIIGSTFNSSGGSRESNGKGTLLICETHELDVNKSKTKSEIEEEYKNKLSVTNIIWLKQGVPQDDSRLNGPLSDQIYPNGVNGHVDQFCRFADAGTILISSVTNDEANMHPILAEAKKRLDENYNILLNSTDQDGKKFKIIKVPLAPLLFMEKSVGSKNIYITPVTSYMNFIVTNSMIILPSYTSTKPDDMVLQNKEKEVEDIFRKTFPNRDIIKVQAAELNSFSGGFHCISINVPE